MIEMKLEGIDGVLETLKSLPPEVVSKRGGLVKLALAKGARILRDEARRNLTRVVSTPGKTGINYGTGFSAKNVITKRKRPIDGSNGERFIVTVRYIPHPNGNKLNKSQPFRANDAAFILEYGSAKQPAEPWLRPAFEAKKEEALNVVTADLVRRIDAVVKKLATQNKGK